MKSQPIFHKVDEWNGMVETWSVTGVKLTPPSRDAFPWPNPEVYNQWRHWGYEEWISPADHMEHQGKKYNYVLDPTFQHDTDLD